MSLTLIVETAKEVRRLAVAGSPLSVGDFRLKKLIAPLEQAGVKVPVFAQVAKGIGELVNGTEAESSGRLLGLSTLLNAILYTQGQSGVEGDLRELEDFATDGIRTRTTARVLRPLIDALTTSGGGRFEVIKSACDSGAFADLRLIEPAIEALGDSYPELADLVAERVLPIYGSGIVARLRSGLDMKGGKEDARKLMVIHRLDPTGAMELCKGALEAGSPEVKVAALACLGSHADCFPIVMEHVRAKNKQVRAAAIEALAEHDQPEVTRLLTALIHGQELELLILPFRKVRSAQVMNALLVEGRRLLDLLLKNDPEPIPRFCEVLECLQHRGDAEAIAFVSDCLREAGRLGKVKAAQKSVLAGADLVARLVALLYESGSAESLDTILDQRDVLPAAAFSEVLGSAARRWRADRFFAEFSPLLDETQKGAAREKSDVLERFIAGVQRSGVLTMDPAAVDRSSLDEGKPADVIGWDPRWLDAAVKGNRHAIVCALARPNHKGALNYLLSWGEATKMADAGMTVQALARCQYPGITGYYLDLVAKKTKGARYLDYELQFLLRSARYLPVGDLPKLDAFAARLDEKFVEAFLEAIAPLRPIPQGN